MELSRRLMSVASGVTKGNRLADIGTDHGYIPIYPVSEGIIPSAIAMDVNQGPLDRADAHIREHGLEDKIGTRLSNGLEKLDADEADTIVVMDIEDPENGVIARGFDELLERVSSWNYEFLQDSEVVGSHREQIIMDMEKIARLIDRVDLLRGMPMGVPTVKELIAILSKLPEDYRVYCCGGENYLYIWEKSKSITIDHEYSLA